jgi:feruloyl esterase
MAQHRPAGLSLGGPEPLKNSLARVRNFHLKDPSREPRLTSIAADVERTARIDGGLVASDNFNLKPFFESGGTLLVWHGWSDPEVPAENSIIYFRNVLTTIGAGAESSIALFLLPGVSHCGGGPGPVTFDKVAPISAWVERRRKPTRLVASHVTDGKVDRTRPLCPFGQVARYGGTGDTKDAANFSWVAASTAIAKAP